MKYFCGTGAAGRGPGSVNVVASWVIACEYLSLGLHLGNHSRPTPLSITSFFVVIVVVVVIFSPRRMGCGAWAWFLARFPIIFCPYGVFRQVFSGPRLTTVSC